MENAPFVASRTGRPFAVHLLSHLLRLGEAAVCETAHLACAACNLICEGLSTQPMQAVAGSCSN